MHELEEDQAREPVCNPNDNVAALRQTTTGAQPAGARIPTRYSFNILDIGGFKL